MGQQLFDEGLIIVLLEEFARQGDIVMNLLFV
jgi:hypothetical protein